jgi:hypothetical protein
MINAEQLITFVICPFGFAVIVLGFVILLSLALTLQQILVCCLSCWACITSLINV